MSSKTAAPRMSLDSGASILPMSRRTRAVIPTLVAASVAPTNRWTYHAASAGRKAEDTA